MQLQIHPPLDLLAAEDGRSLLNEPLIKRRSLLEKFATAHFDRGQDQVVAGHAQARASQNMACKNGYDARRHRRQTAPRGVSVWRARWDAED